MGWGDLSSGFLSAEGSGGLDSSADTNMFGQLQNFIPGVQAGRDAQAAYQQQLQQLIARIDKEWTLPKYDQTPLTQQEYTLLNTYAPQVAGFIQQQAPQLLSNVSNEGTQAQSQALNQLSELSKNGTDEGTRAQYEEANLTADQALRSNRANALNLLAQRGLGTSGQTLNADIGAGIGAAEQQRQASLEAASQAAQRKVQAIQGLGNLGTQVAGQKQQAEQFNANELNQYNQLLANRRQQYQNYIADTQNNANQFNQQQSQQIANINTGLNNQTNTYNQHRADQIQNNLTDSMNDRLRLEAGLQGGGNSQQLGFAQQQAQNETGMFLGALGIGAQALSGGAGGGSGPASALMASKAGSMNGGYQPNSYSYSGNANPNYTLNGYSQQGALQ